MTRTQARKVFRDHKTSGDLHRGTMLFRFGYQEWRVPGMTSKRFYTRQEARDWIDRHHVDFVSLEYEHYLAGQEIEKRRKAFAQEVPNER